MEGECCVRPRETKSSSVMVITYLSFRHQLDQSLFISSPKTATPTNTLPVFKITIAAAAT